MGLICLSCMVANIIFKVESRTLIFILNPCHASNFFLIFLCFTPFSIVGELFAFSLFGFSFGGLLGLIFTENEDLPFFEIFVYYVQHVFVAGLGPLILSLSGRYDIRNYVKYPLPWLGAIFFTLYERFLIMPMSMITYANLNHALCGFDSDPMYAKFDLGRWYWLWAELYLSAACFFGYGFNLTIISLVHIMVGACGLSKNDITKSN